jgi:hypothetical protein
MLASLLAAQSLKSAIEVAINMEIRAGMNTQKAQRFVEKRVADFSKGFMANLSSPRLFRIHFALMDRLLLTCVLKISPTLFK